MSQTTTATPSESDILNALIELRVPVTSERVATHLNTYRQFVHYHLKRLEAQGFVVADGKGRKRTYAAQEIFLNRDANSQVRDYLILFAKRFAHLVYPRDEQIVLRCIQKIFNTPKLD